MGAAGTSFDLQQIWSLQTLYQIVLGSAVVTMVINVTWFVISSGLKQAARRAHLRVKTHSFIVGKSITGAKYDDLSRDVSGFYCLLVRYGTDEYISRIANDQERFEGRQQLRVRRISVTFDWAGKAVFELKLPVHKSLRTQFKCFLVARSVDRVPAIISALEECEHVSDIKQSDSYHRNRIYFLLDQFAVVDTVTSGVKNNYVFPE